MKLLFLFFFYFFAYSCSFNQKDCVIKIKNSANVKIDSIHISSYSLNILFKEILPNTTMEKVGAVSNFGNADGAFLIKIYAKDSIVASGTFGYYSSFADIKSNYEVEVKNGFSFSQE